MTLPVGHGLAERLKRETHDLHAQVERAGVMAGLLRGCIGRPTYCALLRNLHAIYETLERALDAHAAAPWMTPLWQPALRREASLAEDLDTLHGGDWRRAIALETATARYVVRLKELSRSGAVALVAHVYVRHLGDLHGGQLLSRIVRDLFALPDDRGTRFYAFGEPAAVLRLRADFRRGLAGLPVDPPAIVEIVGEARAAFELHRHLFEQLETRPPKASA